jgi:hypothetical protein
VTSSVVYWARDGDQLFIYVREKGMGLIFRIVWFDDMNVLLKIVSFWANLWGYLTLPPRQVQKMMALLVGFFFCKEH